MKNDKRRNTIISIVVSLTVILPLFFLTPINKYIDNKEDMWFNLYSIIIPMLITSIIFSAILFLILKLISKIKNQNVFRIICAILLSISLSFYLQNNFLNIRYGTGKLDGSTISWNNYFQYGVINTAIWVIILIVIISIVFLFKSKWKSIVLVSSLIILSIQIVASAIMLISNPEDFDKKSYNVTTEGIYELSSDNNTLVFILDTLDYDVYSDYIKSNPETKNTLNGFVEYTDALTAGSHTNVALPAILTGNIKKTNEIINDFYNNAWSSTDIYKDLSSANVDTRLFIENGHFGNQFDTTPFANIECVQNSFSFYPNVISKMYKLSLYSEMPHFLKQMFFMNFSDFAFKSQENTFLVNDIDFFNNYRDNHFTISNNYENSFRVYQLHGSHGPYYINKDGNQIMNNGSPIDTSIEEQTEGCFCVIKEMIDELKSKGLYDKATIVIMADHGKYELTQHSAILVKQKNHTEPYTKSDEPISAFDIIPNLAKEITGKDYSFEYSTTTISNNTRSFFLGYNKDQNYSVNKYTTTSNASDLRHLFLTDYDYQSEITPKTITNNKNYDFTNYENIKYNIVTGYSTANNSYTLNGPIVDFVLPVDNLKENEKLELTVSKAEASQEYELYINSIKASSGTIDKENQKIEVNLKQNMLNENNQLILQFNFPNISIEEFETDSTREAKTIPMILNSLIIKD